MFIEFPVNKTNSEYDYVVVGSGISGLMLAEQLSAIGKILVVELGDLDKRCESGSGFYEIESIGYPMRRVNTRIAAFGGSLNHWDGNSRPFSPTIFANRIGMPAWPISYTEYAQYLPDAEKYLNLISHQPDDSKSNLPHPLLERHENLRVMHFQHSDPLRELGDQATVKKFSRAEHIDVVLDTRVVDINLDVDGLRVESVDLFHRPSAKKQVLKIKQLILCAGGIENPRLMLFAGRKYPTGNPLLGGPNELTGKWFSEHPRFRPVDLFIDDRIDLSGAAPARVPGRSARWYLTVSDTFMENHLLPRFGVSFVDAGWWPDESVMAGADEHYYHRSEGYWWTTPYFIFEQTPVPESQVMLSESKDENGFPLACVNWQVANDDINRMRRAVLLFCGLIAQHGVARCRLIADAQGDDWSGLEILPGCHHMGTTRMASESLAGVVDTNLRVFGLDNMYVAGSSVFPSCDWVNPTLNLTTLTARLADHLVQASYKAAETMLLMTGSQSLDVLGDGWSAPEPEGVWSDGSQAELNIATQGARQLRLFGRPYASAQVVMAVNGRQIYTGPCGGLFNTTFKLDGQSSAHVTFHLTNLSAPQSIGENNDTRLLGLFLNGLQVR